MMKLVHRKLVTEGVVAHKVLVPDKLLEYCASGRGFGTGFGAHLSAAVSLRAHVAVAMLMRLRNEFW